jgi:plastocyanin
MSRIRIVPAVCAAALAAGVSAAVAAAHATPTLHAFDADPLKIGLTLHGKTVKTLKSGTYAIVVEDTASDHDFHLKGPGLDKKTSVGAKQTVTWRVTLKKGTYTYVCDPHASIMKGKFEVR